LNFSGRPLEASSQRIAVIGAGIAGLSCAWLLSKRHDVTLFEAEARLGGHSHTVDVTVGGETLPVDTGFIVYNDVNYPNLVRLFELLGVPTEPSDMSFSVSVDGGRYEYASTLPWGPFCQPANLLKPKFLRMLADIVRFYRHAMRARSEGLDEDTTLREFLDRGGYARTYWYEHLLPMASAIWSTPIEQVLDFDAAEFIRFYDEHGLLRFRNRPKWRTVTGGSREYVGRLADDFAGRVRLATPVKAVVRDGRGAEVRTQTDVQRFDQIVFATHADVTASILGTGMTTRERAALEAFEYARSEVVLHQDAAHMPRRRSAWASWNYHARSGMDTQRDVPVTYWMNRLQNIDERTPLFASLNAWSPAREGTVLGRFVYDHPVFSVATTRAQETLRSTQGQQGTWYCGAHCGFGFHEDGFKSALRVARSLGVAPPWQAIDAEPFLQPTAIAA